MERVSSRHECMELCLQEDSFICRSSNYNEESMQCAMSDKDRFTVNDADFLVEEENTYYLESNCVSDPNTLCGFIKLNGNILKTVDSVHQDVSNFEACRQLCLNTKDFRCHTFDFDMAGDNVCRLSHHATASLHHIDEPYLDLEDVITYQLASCFNVTIECRATDILARIKTNKVFNGKVYSKTRPNSCVTDVINSLEFDLRLGYNDLNCDVKQNPLGRFGTEIIIQHHDHIVTNQDVGLSLRCLYNFQNNSVGHGVELEVTGNIETSNKEESSYIVSPRVTMRITDRFGEDINTAQVGDALSLRFDIIDRDSQYQIFVRELIAMDGIDTSQAPRLDNTSSNNNTPRTTISAEPSATSHH
uniref:Uncharacterized protein n=1 Tax=Timema douglasi TaxID=61478 RepID=A0A7R8Z872_TIMDO|nr:unnamed protein product [Timema douglasi]